MASVPRFLRQERGRGCLSRRNFPTAISKSRRSSATPSAPAALCAAYREPGMLGSNYHHRTSSSRNCSPSISSCSTTATTPRSRWEVRRREATRPRHRCSSSLGSRSSLQTKSHRAILWTAPMEIKRTYPTARDRLWYRTFLRKLPMESSQGRRRARVRFSWSRRMWAGPSTYIGSALMKSFTWNCRPFSEWKDRRSRATSSTPMLVGMRNTSETSPWGRGWINIYLSRFLHFPQVFIKI